MGEARLRPKAPEIIHEKLPNGLQLYLVQDSTTPLVTCQIWYRVGSTHEHEGAHGITGLSHFLEHMLFRGTERFPDCFQAVYARGGQLNGWTWYDATCFWEKLPAGNLGFALELEADRLKNLRLEPLAFEQEREVVRNERLLRAVNDPAGALEELLHRRVFETSPYRWPVLGWPQDLISVTPEDAWEYFRSHYHPGNAFLVIAGDFDPAEAVALAAQHFGDLPGGARPPRAPAVLPPQQAERRDHMEKAIANGLLQMAYQAPAAADPDFLALEVLNYLLAHGKSSRLQRALIYGRDAVASRITTSLWAMRDPYMYVFEVHVAPGRTNREAERRIDAVLQQICDEPVDPAELHKAVSGMRAELVRAGLETQGKANLIGFSLLTTGRPETFFQRLVEAERLVPADLQRVARTWLDPARRTVVAAVHPARLDQLTRSRWSDGAGPEQQLLLRALEQARLRHEQAQERARLDEEAAAIALLEARLAQEQVRLEALPDGAEALRQLARFRLESTKGVEPRRRALELAVEKLQARQAEAAGQAEQLARELAELAPDGTAPPLAALARAALGLGPLPPVTELTALAPPEDAALLLLHDARLAARAGLRGEAQAALVAILDLERDSPQNSFLEQAAALAWEYRVA